MSQRSDLVGSKKDVLKLKMRAALEVNREAETSAKREGETSEQFQVKPGIRQNLELYPLFFAIVVEALTANLVKIKNFLYANHLEILT